MALDGLGLFIIIVYERLGNSFNTIVISNRL